MSNHIQNSVLQTSNSKFTQKRAIRVNIS